VMVDEDDSSTVTEVCVVTIDTASVVCMSAVI